MSTTEAKARLHTSIKELDKITSLLKYALDFYKKDTKDPARLDILYSHIDKMDEALAEYAQARQLEIFRSHLDEVVGSPE